MRLDDLLAAGAAVADGAWGTQLQARGLPPGACPDAWNLDRPEAVRAVAAAYVAAGSRVILTNTFGANRVVLARHGLAGRAAEINRAGAALSRAAAGDRALVAASIGPSGRLLAADEISADELRAAFAEQAAALAAGGADAAVVETQADPGETAIAVECARAAGLPAIVSFTFDSGRQGDRTLTGLTPERAAALAADLGAVAAGFNCGLGPAEAAAIAVRMRTATRLPLWIKPNRGKPRPDGSYDLDAAGFADAAAGLAAGGACIIGGCCGSDPACIAALAERLR